MKKINTILLLIASAFLFSSCGDSKSSVVDDSIDLMEEMAVAVEKGDEAKLKSLQEEAEKLQQRAKELGFNIEDQSSLTDKQRKRMGEAMQKLMKAAF